MGLVPLDGKLVHGDLGLLDGRSLVDGFQVGGHGLTLLPRNIVQAVTHHMHQAELNLGIGKNRLDCFREAFEIIDAGNEDVLNAPILSFGHDLEPELRAFCFGGPHAQDLFATIKIETYGQIVSYVDDASVLKNFDADFLLKTKIATW